MSEEPTKDKNVPQNSKNAIAIEKNRFLNKLIYNDSKLVFEPVKKITDIKDDCLVVLDTSVLLFPFSTGKESLKEIKKVYEKLIREKRLIIPGQVAREYARRRPEMIVNIYQQLDDKKLKVSMPSYPILENTKSYKTLTDLEHSLTEITKNYSRALAELMEEIIEWEGNDPISLIYNELGFQNIIHEIEVDIKEIQIEATRRKDYSIPPGYKDSSKDENSYGDLLIWWTILDLIKDSKKNLIFVSSDNKADWWHRSKQKTILPRYELLDEFRNKGTGGTFHILSVSQFLALFSKNDKVINEIKQEEKEQTIYEIEDNEYTHEEVLGMLKYKISIRSDFSKFTTIFTERNHYSDFYYIDTSHSIIGVYLLYYTLIGEAILEGILESMVMLNIQGNLRIYIVNDTKQSSLQTKRALYKYNTNLHLIFCFIDNYKLIEI